MKSQAQTASKLGMSDSNSLQKGTVLRDIELLFADGHRQLLSQFRGRSNLVIVSEAEVDRVSPLLAGLAAQASAIRNRESKVLLIGAPGRFSAESQQSTFPVAGISSATTLPAGARVIITDRFGEIFAAFRNGSDEPIPSANEILLWLDFINQQCEECSPPEW
jgi:hypothetical protein